MFFQGREKGHKQKGDGGYRRQGGRREENKEEQRGRMKGVNKGTKQKRQGRGDGQRVQVGGKENSDTG